ncbi:MAG: NAD(P)H-binding protein [Erythrobacter sp.]|nr:NAD(P)H-binding protein [Erythrobacter sp.]
MAERKRIALAGATGTIGRAVAGRLLAQGHALTCLIRRGSSETCLPRGAYACPVDFTQTEGLARALAQVAPETVISCIASRSGAPKDAWEVDHRINSRLLQAAEQSGSVSHFILLSAICVQKPRLVFQHAKLAFEAELIASRLNHTIVRPTAFFKSLSGQVARVMGGKPFLLFGDGALTRCKPISDDDLARFISECVSTPGRRGKVLPIGGQGPAITPREQGEMLFELTGQKPRYRSVSPRMFDYAERLLSAGAPISDWFAAKAEYARIARYYATESMLVLDRETGEYSPEATPEYGTQTLREHYRGLIEARREA